MTCRPEFSASRSSNTAAAANTATAGNAAAAAANAAAAAAANAANTEQQCSSSKGSRYEILIAHTCNAAHRGRTGEGQGGGSNGRIWAGRGSSAITKQVGRINSK